MKQSGILQLLQSQRWLVVDGAAYGVLNEYPFMVQAPRGNSVSISITLSQPPEREQSKALRDAMRNHGTRCRVNGRVVSYPLRLGDPSSQQVPAQLHENIRNVTGLLRQLRLMPPTACGLCGQGGTDAFVLRNLPPAGYDAVHACCADAMLSGAQQQVQQNPGSYLTGILGALAGAFVGALPAFFVLHFLHVISAWLFMLLPLGSYFGYKLLRGKMTAAAGISAVVCSLLGLALVILAWDTAVNMTDLELGFSDAIRLTWHYTFVDFSIEYWEWLSPNIASILLFYILGVVFSLGIVSRTNKTALKSVEQMRATMLVRVNPAAQTAQQPDPAGQEAPEQI